MVNLGLLPGGMFYSVAYAVSGDGSVVVGCGDSPNGWAEAALWTAETGWVGLGDLPGGDFYSIAYAVSPDGSIVVGRGTHEHPLYSEAFIWDAQNGMRMVRDWLAGNGVMVPSSWWLAEARGVTVNANGKVITVVGWGRDHDHPLNKRQPWLAVVDQRSPGDVNGDGCVDDTDLMMVHFAYGSRGFTRLEDLNRDNIVDDTDLIIVIMNYGNGC